MVTPFTNQQVVSACVGMNCLRKARPSETGCVGFKLLQTICIVMYPPRILKSYSYAKSAAASSMSKHLLWLTH
jgi:hypothetical protein